MRRKLLAGNWKMNKTRAECPGFFAQFAKECGDLPALLQRADLMFAVPFTILETVFRYGQMHQFATAAQNVHWEPSGAYTGEVSAGQLLDLSIHYTLVGHSERRQYFGETDETVGQKTKACLQNKVTPVVCVGETRSEREANRTEAVVVRQLSAVMSNCPEGTGLVIAYEPVWAIGTGLSATTEQAEEVHVLIRKEWGKRFGETSASALRILYGGSANASNAAALFAKPDIDGALVGGASLKPADFAAMLKAAAQR